MKSLILLVVLVSGAAAAVQDLSGKLVTFLGGNYRSMVVKTEMRELLSAFTVCHRSFTDLMQIHTLFSLSTPNERGAFKIDYDNSSPQIRLVVHSTLVGYTSVDYAPNKWHSICSTWSSSSGMVQLWMDGQALSRKYTRDFPITGPLTTILGQKPVKYGDTRLGIEFFIGMMSDVHMWDHVLSPCEIQRYMKDMSYTPGNIINWRALDFETNGAVFIEDKQICTSLF